MTQPIPHVSKGDPIKAADWNNMADAANDYLDQTKGSAGAVLNPAKYAVPVTISNGSGSNKSAGDTLAITGSRFGGTPSEAAVKYLDSGIALSGGTPSASSTLAVLIESIPTGGIGKAVVPGIFAAFVAVSNTNHGYAEAAAGGLASSESGGFKILAKSSVADGKAFCYLVALGWSAVAGHLVGTTADSITGSSAETTAAGKTVTCPLLKSSETIASGTKVIISRNQSSGNWQIIEAQCPSGS